MDVYFTKNYRRSISILHRQNTKHIYFAQWLESWLHCSKTCFMGYHRFYVCQIDVKPIQSLHVNNPFYDRKLGLLWGLWNHSSNKQVSKRNFHYTKNSFYESNKQSAFLLPFIIRNKGNLVLFLHHVSRSINHTFALPLVCIRSMIHIVIVIMIVMPLLYESIHCSQCTREQWWFPKSVYIVSIS